MIIGIVIYYVFIEECEFGYWKCICFGMDGNGNCEKCYLLGIRIVECIL